MNLTNGFLGALLVAIPASLMGPCGTRSSMVRPEPSATAAKAPTVATSPGPLDQFNLYLDEFHFVSGDLREQSELHHHCSEAGPGIYQCLMFDGPEANARLVGIEYVVTADIFAGFPDSEKRLWHSHAFEARSGQLMAPRQSLADERQTMRQFVTTYGKAWRTWETYKGKSKALPTGVPALLMSFVGEGQLDYRKLDERDRRWHQSTQLHRWSRRGLPQAETDPEADYWKTGRTPHLQVLMSHRPRD